jgi:hypothetical protein
MQQHILSLMILAYKTGSKQPIHNLLNGYESANHIPG